MITYNDIRVIDKLCHLRFNRLKTLNFLFCHALFSQIFQSFLVTLNKFIIRKAGIFKSDTLLFKKILFSIHGKKRIFNIIGHNILAKKMYGPRIIFVWLK